MRNIVIIADYFLNECMGGSEIYTNILINKLPNNKTLCKCGDITDNLFETWKINKTFLLISNFKLLSEPNKKRIMNEFDYAIIDHDPQWDKKNNPALYPSFLLPEENILHKEFYKKAKAVFVQSRLHADIIVKNLLLDNVINLGCNLWDDEKLNLLENNIGKTKTRKYGVMDSQNKNKGTPQTIDYCRRNNIMFDLIAPCNQKEFYEELAKTETLVFLPQWIETYSRVVIEARILECKVLTNKLVGCTSEPYFELRGKSLLDFIKNEQQNVIQKIDDVVLLSTQGMENKEFFERMGTNPPNIKFYPLTKLPKVSLITTFHNGLEYIDGFMEMVKKQTYNNFEVLVLGANPSLDEDRLMDKYIKNVKYMRTEEKITTSAAFNKLVKQTTGDFIAICLIDDRMSPDYLEVMAKHLHNNTDVDLVYSDHFVTKKANEVLLINSSRGKLWEHSRNEFSKENMIKCLPSPMFMCRKSMWEKNNGFDENLLNSCDWDFFLRCVENDSVFKKINKPLGLYYFSPTGLSTDILDQEKVKRRHKEEKETFFKYGPKIFPKNFELFKSYFENL